MASPILFVVLMKSRRRDSPMLDDKPWQLMKKVTHITALLLICFLTSPLAASFTPVVHAQSPQTVADPTIIGGSETAPDAWPWQAALVDASATNAYEGQFCGGALIDP